MALKTETKTELLRALDNSKKYLSKLSFQQGMYENSILSHNYVISVGAYTISTKKEGSKKILDYRFRELPSLWTKEGAEASKKALQENDDREITIKGKHAWYADEITKVRSAISSVESILRK